MSLSLFRGMHVVLSPAGHRGRLLIFTFHRVLAVKDALLPGEPDGPEFESKMQWVAECCQVLPLPAAARRLAAGTLPSRAACITFDDGYADNAEVAAPILRSLGLSASFFIAVDAVRTGIMWNDLVLDAIRSAGRDLDFGIVGTSANELVSVGSLAAFADRVLAAMKYLPRDERWERAQALHRAATGGEPPRRHMMTPDAVRRLSAAGFDIGGHTVTHPILAELPDDAAAAEIRGCRDWLTELNGRAPASFAYPNGRPGQDYHARHVAMVRDAGFEVAVSTRWASASSNSDPLQLPRFAPWETTRRAFLARVLRTCLAS